MQPQLAVKIIKQSSHTHGFLMELGAATFETLK